MSHIPINHPLRPLYRTLAGLVGLYVLILGVRGFMEASGLDFFQQDHLPWVLGLRVNPAFAALSVVAGVVILAANVVGRNLAHYVDLAGGALFLVAGLAMLALLQSSANFLGFSMINCIVSFICGLVLLASGLYCKVGPVDHEEHDKVRRTDADRKATVAS